MLNFKLILACAQFLAILQVTAFDYDNLQEEYFRRPTFKVKRLDDNWIDAYNNRQYVNIDLRLRSSSVTLSGYKQGGAMVSNLLAMFNDRLAGGAMVEGNGPCATVGLCTTSGQTIADYGKEGLKGKRIFVFGKSRQETNLVGFFRGQKSIVTEVKNDLGKVFSNDLTPSEVNPKVDCQPSTTGMNNCGADYAGQYLKGFYSNLRSRNEKSITGANANLYVIDQTRFTNKDSGLWEYGFLYVPRSCENRNDCPLHIFFHDCDSGADKKGTRAIRQTGLLEYASANQMVVFFPQAYNAANSQQCWIAGDQTSSSHPQIETLRKMVKALYFDDLFVTEQPPRPMMGSGLVEDRKEFQRVIVFDKSATRVTVLCFVILIFKMVKSNFEVGIIKYSTGNGMVAVDRKRWEEQMEKRVKQGNITPEQQAKQMEASLKKEENLKRIRMNDLESMTIGLPTMIASLLFGRRPLAHIIMCIFYTFGRCTHTITYKMHLQPWRLITFMIAQVGLVSMVIHSIIGVFWSVEP